MALSPARAAAVVVAGCALAAAAWLPPEPPESRDARRTLGAVQRLRVEVRQSSRQLAMAVETLVFLRRRDSLAAVADRPPAGHASVAAPGVPLAWSSWLADGAERAEVGGTPVLTAVFMDTSSWRARKDDERRWESWSNSTITAVGPAAAPYACATIHDLRRLRAGVLMSPDRSPPRNPLGVCRFIASYGLPGPAVQTWLLGGGSQFAATDGADHRGAFEFGRGREDVIPFMMRDGHYRLSACIQGAVRGCRAWFLQTENPGDPIRGEVRDWRAFAPLDVPGAFVEGWWGDLFGGLLDDLATEMGGERFRAFWTSSAPVDSAFVSAFGMDSGTWTRDWLGRRFGPLPRRGPRRGDYAAAAVFAGLLVAFAAAAGQRRQAR